MTGFIYGTVILTSVGGFLSVYGFLSVAGFLSVGGFLSVDETSEFTFFLD
jgi:hypothetical protein